MTQKGDSLGDRMKRYEGIPQIDVMRRTPVIIRIDGRAFHTFTKQVKRQDPDLGVYPFSKIMLEAMVFTTETLVREVQNCVLGYTQSDEISLLLCDWYELETQPWFGNNVQKMVSVSASIATAAFNFAIAKHLQVDSLSNIATFDSRVYNLPKEEVTNYFLWRQNDASRNSIQMLGHHHFSQKQMHAKSNVEVQDMLFLEKGINWNDIPTWMKRGSCVTTTGRDMEIPIFSQDRSYIDRLLISPEQREDVNE